MTEKKEKDKTCFYGFGCFQVNILPSKVLSGKCLYIVYFGVYNMHTGNIYIIYIIYIIYYILCKYIDVYMGS